MLAQMFIAHRQSIQACSTQSGLFLRTETQLSHACHAELLQCLNIKRGRRKWLDYLFGMYLFLPLS